MNTADKTIEASIQGLGCLLGMDTLGLNVGIYKSLLCLIVRLLRSIIREAFVVCIDDDAVKFFFYRIISEPATF